MRIISLDVGEKSLGIAISDKLQIIPIPYENYFFERNNFSIAVKHIINILLKEKDIFKILIGKPLMMDGNSNNNSYKNVILFKKELEKSIILNKIDSKTIFIDERLSTKRAKNILSDKYKKEFIDKNKDMFSAYVILYDFLNRR